MRFSFYSRAPFQKQKALRDAVTAGAATCGDKVEGIEDGDGVRNVDGLILLGIGGDNKRVYDAYAAAGKHTVLWDKGYTRGGGWFRVAVNAFQPTEYFQMPPRPRDRLRALNLPLDAYDTHGMSKRRHVLFDGASNKFCLWKGIPDWIAWGEETVRKIREHTDLPIIYRPRPSHNNELERERLRRVPDVVPDAELSARHLAEDFARARVVVSVGGNIGFEAVCAGVPHFATGDSIARPLSETDWARVDLPYVPLDEERRQWLADVSWCQWRLEEIASGEAWRVIREQLTV